MRAVHELRGTMGMIARMTIVLPVMLLLGLLAMVGCSGETPTAESGPPESTAAARQSAASRVERMSLPSPDLNGNVSLETAIQDRRSVRRYAPEPLDLADVSQLLWAAQGVTSESGGRAAPSAGGLYPLEVYAVVGEVRDLSPGVYRYVPDAHGLDHIGAEDERAELAAACLDQEWVEAAPVTLVITGVYSRTASKYGDRAERYVHLEAGHAGQNVYLQATALGLGTVCVGAFRDEEVQDALGIPDDETPLYVMPVGRPVD